jgi:hypothetical protein
MEIKYLNNAQIDKDSWDSCIKNSYNSLIYGYSWYLDSLADNWDAIVVGNYDAVFPLPFRKKMGICYLYQPFFMQQLGLFPRKDINISIDEVLDAIPQKFKYWDLQINGSFKSTKYSLEDKTTLHIDLSDPYETIKSRYSKDAIKNIRKANASNWELCTNNNIDLVLNDYKKAYGELNHNILELDYDNLTQALTIATKQKMVNAYSLIDENKERMGSAIFLKSNNAIHYIMGAPTEKGRKISATHVLIDLILKENSGTNAIFDFEGSEIPSVANFYKKFGVKKYTYYKLRVNKLPFPLSLLKK